MQHIFVERTTITVNTKSMRADTFPASVLFSGPQPIYHNKLSMVSRDFFTSQHPNYCLLGLPNLKISIPTEKFHPYEHDKLASVLTYIFLRTQLKGFHA